MVRVKGREISRCFWFIFYYIRPQSEYVSAQKRQINGNIPQMVAVK
jgi:hypothetical protein